MNSHDVVSLFTNVPILVAMDVIRERLVAIDVIRERS